MNQVKGKSVGLEYDFTGLDNFVKAMDTAGKFVVRVGIFGNKNAREIAAAQKTGKSSIRKTVRGTTSTLTNAELGIIHELGSIERGIPPRSFLRMPLQQRTKEILADATKGAAEMIAKGNILGVLKRLGIACEKQIQLAFATRGFGSWQPDAPATVRKKGSNQPLIDTAQLRRSIASQVVAK